MDVIIRIIVGGLIVLGAAMAFITALLFWFLWWLGAWAFQFFS